MKTIPDFPFTNWAGNVKSNAITCYFAQAEEDLQEVVQDAAFVKRRIRVVGGAHSWSPLASCDDYLINMDRYSRVLAMDMEKMQVRVQAGIRLKDLNKVLDKYGLALKQLGSISEQSIAGALATGTHGSGMEFRILSSAIVSMRIVTGVGAILHINEDDPRLDAFRVNIGSLGIVSEVTLQCRKAFLLREDSVPMRFDDALAQLPALLKENQHMKLWWFPHVDRLMVYRYNAVEGEQASPVSKVSRFVQDVLLAQYFFASVLRIGSVIPALIPAINRMICALHLKKVSRVGKSYELFNVAMPPKHYESEFAIPVEKAAEALRAVRKMIEDNSLRVNFVVEVRFVQGDNYWLSPAYGRDSCYLGCYLYGGDKRWKQYRERFEQLMQQYGGRPHWGKDFTPALYDFTKIYERWNEFLILKSQMDPHGLFGNHFTDSIFGSK